MCGIVGIIKEEGHKASYDTLKIMASFLNHRGPNEEGYFVKEEAALGIKRLSIIDIKQGKQPQTSKDSRFNIVFNGEIYNYKEIKKHLLDIGRTFHTNSDTEVILETFIHYKYKCLELFNGMFAIAIWDSLEKKLFLARDRLGVKPIYYSFLKDGTFIFASEIKALIQYPEFIKEFNPHALDNLLTYGFQLCPDTFFRNISQVLPGHYMTVSLDAVKQFCYWDLNFQKEKLKIKKEEISKNLYSELNEAVKRRLVADVPIASYLSGGIDSSAVTCLYSKLENSMIRTFSIGFPHPDYDESYFSDIVSKHIGTEHTSFMCEPNEDDFEKLIWHLEDPLYTLLNLPLYYLSKKVQESGFKVVLSGDGADEFLGGYSYFKMMKMLEFINKNPNSNFRKLIFNNFDDSLDTSMKIDNFYQFLMLRKLQSPMPSLPLPYIFHTFPDKYQLLSNKIKEQLSIEDKTQKLFFNPSILKEMSFMDRIFYLESKFRLLNLTLPLSDKMSMANSIENRSPFLDYKFIEFLTSIPNEYKIFGLNEKFILKESMKPYLPKEIINRQKKPLSASSSWFLKILGERAKYYLSEEVIIEKGYFNPQKISFMKERMKESKGLIYSDILLIVIFLHLWDELFIKN